MEAVFAKTMLLRIDPGGYVHRIWKFRDQVGRNAVKRCSPEPFTLANLITKSFTFGCGIVAPREPHPFRQIFRDSKLRRLIL